MAVAPRILVGSTLFKACMTLHLVQRHQQSKATFSPWQALQPVLQQKQPLLFSPCPQQALAWEVHSLYCLCYLHTSTHIIVTRRTPAPAQRKSGRAFDMFPAGVSPAAHSTACKTGCMRLLEDSIPLLAARLVCEWTAFEHCRELGRQSPACVCQSHCYSYTANLREGYFFSFLYLQSSGLFPC